MATIYVIAGPNGVGKTTFANRESSYEGIRDSGRHHVDVEDWQVERALQKAAIDAIRRARQFGTEYVIWEDGQMKCLKPHETQGYERRAPANLDQINARIAELQARQPREHAAPVLKEEPPKPEPTE